MDTHRNKQSHEVKLSNYSKMVSIYIILYYIIIFLIFHMD